ncbi:TPA: hypothetical protein ACIJTN_005206 [Klebsiella pneumoniae]|nr:hypothetical protein [Klebsiella pneumoniae]HBQ5671353.1 hypothetical protein [Klebsiella quasipneumoniae]HDT4013862.1 hypothetical protein [Klebsiella pneumoniae subsp. pneumoniae]EME9711155.1 hypothetical protein [Klebsiella pneumoniae]MBH1950707.1 hypothetical protein [Klebsiella pneumoniae]MBH1955793.1 hypothetical protein [Klebsiella pneumoniae]
MNQTAKEDTVFALEIILFLSGSIGSKLLSLKTPPSKNGGVLDEAKKINI